MQIKRIVCPSCNVALQVKNSKNELLKQIVCPSCRTPLQVRFAPQQIPANAYAGTQLVSFAANNILWARLEYEGAVYPLKEGDNIVGRQGITSQATVQIETDDRFMSRQHCIITVKTLTDGTKKVVLKNFQNKNVTSVDGYKLLPGDEIRLSDGNNITMGHTTVVFQLS